MTDHPDTLARHRLPLTRDHLKHAAAALPFLRYVPKNPVFLIGAAAVGLVGLMAWRNRERIAARTGPVIADARVKSHALLDQARTRGGDLIDQARTATRSAAAKAPRVRRRAGADATLNDVH